MEDDKEIIDFVNKIQFINLNQQEIISIRHIKWENFKNSLKHKKQNSIAGFKMGMAIGFILGFATGIPSYYKSRKVLDLIIPMLFSGCFFGSIFSIGPFIHQDDVFKEEYVIYSPININNT